MPLIYDTHNIVPAPLLTISKNFVSTPAGSGLNSTFTINLNGTLLPNKGSPDSNGVFGSSLADEAFTTDADKFKSILNKQQAIRSLFGSGYKQFSWEDSSNTVAVSGFPVVNNMSFSEGLWVERCDYSIELECNRLFGPDLDTELENEHLEKWEKYGLISVSQSYDFSEDEHNVVSYTATTTATAKTGSSKELGPGNAHLLADEEGWKRAKAWVTLVSNANPLTESFLIGGFGGTSANRKRTETWDVMGGSYTLSVTYIRKPDVSPNARHYYTIKHESSNPDPTVGDGYLGTADTFNIAGEVLGWGDTGAVRYAGATGVFDITGFDFPDIINTDVGHSLALTEDHLVSSVVTRNPTAGNIQYDLTYSLGQHIAAATGRYSVSISEQDVGEYDDDTVTLVPTVLAIIPIPGRAAGPIIQEINTRPSRSRVVNFSLNFRPDYTGVSDNPNAYTGGLYEGRTVFDTVITDLSLAPVVPSPGSYHITDFSDNYNVPSRSYAAVLTYTMFD